MLSFNVSPPPGDKITSEVLDRWRAVVPSLVRETGFSDGSVNVQVADSESDDLTDLWDASGLEYTLL